MEVYRSSWKYCKSVGILPKSYASYREFRKFV